MVRAIVGVAAWFAAVASAAAAETRTFRAAEAGEAVAVVRAACAGCDWGAPGREGAVIRVEVDGRYSQHLVVTRGEAAAEYRVLLGPVGPGDHQVRLAVDAALSAPLVGDVAVSDVTVRVVGARDDEYLATSLAPVLHARPDTIGRFSDVPLLMYYEVAADGRGGREYRYTVIFTNEDGGTPPDRLMATWGRTTDIEFVYGVRIDARGLVVSEEIQAPGHAVVPFRGRHDGRHPLLWVATDNNMVDAAGAGVIRHAPAPEFASLDGRSREVVMDRHPWTYRVMAAELAREHRIETAAPAGSGRIPDPRAFVFVETCAAIEHAALAVSVGQADAAGGTVWSDVDRQVPEFRVGRTGCARVGVPVATPAARVVAVRVRAHPGSRPDAEPSSAALESIAGVFVLDEEYAIQPRGCAWHGRAPLPIDGPWHVVTCP